RRGGRWRRAARQSDDRFGLLRRAPATTPTARRRRGAAAGTATARRPLPPVARRAVLHHARIGAHRVAAQILLPGVAVVLPVLERGVADLDQGILISRIVLGPAGE